MLLTVGLPSLRAVEPPPLPVIIQRVVDRAGAEQKMLSTMQYDQLALIDDLDDAGHSVRHQESSTTVRPGAAQPVAPESAKGHSSSADSARKSRRDGLHENVDQGRQQFSLAKMVDHFNVTFEGEVDLAGRPAYLLGFEPKKDQDADGLIERVLNQLHGRIWVNPVNYSILRTDAHLVAPVSIGYFIATIKQLDFHYLFEGKSVKDLGPAELTITVWVDIPVLPSIHQRQVLKLTNFRALE